MFISSFLSLFLSLPSIFPPYILFFSFSSIFPSFQPLSVTLLHAAKQYGEAGKILSIYLPNSYKGQMDMSVMKAGIQNSIPNRILLGKGSLQAFVEDSSLFDLVYIS